MNAKQNQDYKYESVTGKEASPKGPKTNLHKFQIDSYRQPKKIVFVKSFAAASAMMELKEGHENHILHCPDCQCFGGPR